MTTLEPVPLQAARSAMLCDVERTREFMARHGLSALVGTTPENVAYLSNFDNPLPFYSGTLAAAVLPRDPARPGVFVPGIAYLAHLAEAPTWMPAIRPFGALGVRRTDAAVRLEEPESSTWAAFEAFDGQRAPDLITAIALALADAGAGDGPIGIDDVRVASRLPAPWADEAWVDATGLFREIRAVKTPAEVARLRRAAAINERAFLRANATVRAGGEWADVARAWRVTWAEEDGTPGYWGSGAGAHSAQIYPPFGAYAIRPGDLVRWEGGGYYGQYWSDSGRTSVVGEPTERQRRYFGALARGAEVARELIRPGARGDDICEQVLRAIRGGGIPDFPESNVWGHGIGLTANELPRLRRGVSQVLEPGMVLCFETPYFELGWGGLQIEDTYLVTEGGNELLTQMPRELVVV